MRIALVVIAIAGCAEPRVLSAPCTGDGCAARVHPPGILDPASADFHGTYLENHDWDFSICQGCHGDDFRGGKAQVSCIGCHADGPTACSTCHAAGAPFAPISGAHATHLAEQLACSECHVTPATWNDHPHGAPLVQFGARANLTIDPADRAGPPTFDGTTCSNVYCHGAVLHMAGGTKPQPRWDDPTPPGGCTTCHAAPPPSHQRSDCATCHPASAPHIDGIVQVGRTSGCDGCHGSAASPAPPTDLAGHTFTTAIGVGAHQAHLLSSFLRGPISCDTCHQVPAIVTDPGHLLPSPAPVNAAVQWDRVSQTCGTYCHGLDVPGVVSPMWTTTGTAPCGSCHGIPPTDAPHTPAMTWSDCASCHPVFPDQHMNGVVDVH
jgi:predicted CxxxxCH...CXXCH cytochrome family protein